MIGRAIYHYRIVEKLGEGGRGAVYKAEDTRLKRAVALKFFDPLAFDTQEEKQRFIREAQLEASLDHPNICTIYEINELDDQIFVAMAYVEGVTLQQKIQSGALDILPAIDVAMQAGKGLSAAHERGVMHGDFKSSNIMLTEDGQVKITDFALAALPGDAGLSEPAVAGDSAAYMSPEQARSDVTDERSDIWALGIVLYEMLTGSLPFRADFDAALRYAILNAEPPSLSEVRAEIPSDLERIVNKMIVKDRDGRYQSMEEASIDLSAVKRRIESGVRQRLARANAKPSIAVLPFVDMSPEKDQEYFCDGIAEEITGALTRVEGLRVVARTSAFSFKGKNVDIPEIGRRLGVGTLLEGSLRKAGQRLRIAVQLTNSSDSYEIWSQTYDRDLEDVFAIQDEIRLAIVAQLKVTLLGDDRAALVKRHTVDPEAFSLYWKGRFFWNKRTEEGYQRGLSYFRQAIEQDPSYALAYVGVADCYDLLGWYDYLAPDEAFPKARAAAYKAMEMDERLAEAHATAGWICVNYEWKWDCAEREYRRALALNSGYATAHQWYAEYLSYLGRHQESIHHGERAVELDPLSIIINNDLGQVLYYAREYDRAIDQLHRTLEMESAFAIPYFFLAFAHVQKREYPQAIRAARKAMELSGGNDPLNVAQTGAVYSFSGDADRAHGVLEMLHRISRKRYVSPFCRAVIHVGLGQHDDAFDWLDKAYETHDHWLETLRVHPILDALRKDRRYGELLAKMRLDW
ncbi:MAG: tetratricopeptide repeat-containing serine/threonine-protein kinase [Candidatus Krumholzibacteria bacterium]|nr:tetratricopeptide repeat-containing serine/threonine-protein kinase [Candidatus Krumholzibacteria bacterium]